MLLRIRSLLLKLLTLGLMCALLSISLIPIIINLLINIKFFQIRVINLMRVYIIIIIHLLKFSYPMLGFIVSIFIFNIYICIKQIVRYFLRDCFILLSLSAKWFILVKSIFPKISRHKFTLRVVVWRY